MDNLHNDVVAALHSAEYVNAAAHNSLSLWHSRLGHPSYSSISPLKNTLLIADFANNSLPCNVCPLAKQKRLSFTCHNNRSKHLFDLIHADVWGPFSTISHAGHRYFLTIVDDFSRYSWVFMLKNKSDVLSIIPQFFKLVETQYNKTIKMFRSDNAPELKFDEFFREKGVVHQFSCVARPEQNSVVERKHQHILNVARALYFQSRVPLKFWSDCILTAVFLINITPSHVLQWKTPFELLHCKSPDYSLLKVFGCLCFAATLPTQRSKFSPRAIPAVFIGYPPGMKAYKLFDIEKQRFFESRDVVFHEGVFPFHKVTVHGEQSDFLSDLVLPKPTNIKIPYPNPLSINQPSTNTESHTSQDQSPPPNQANQDIQSNQNTNQPNHPPSSSQNIALPHISPPINRKSSRISKPPTYLKDYHCSLISKTLLPSLSTKYPLQNSISYQKLFPSFKTFSLNISSHYEPQFYHQALPYAHWKEAMQLELEAMEINNTWCVVPLPPNKHSIGCKWIFKIKHKANGSSNCSGTSDNGYFLQLASCST